MSDDHLDRSADDQISRRVVLGRIAGAGVVATAASAALGGSNALAQQPRCRCHIDTDHATIGGNHDVRA